MDKLKQQTMMRLGELQCFDEQQRIDIFEMVKQGAISVEVRCGRWHSAAAAAARCKPP